MCIFLHFRLHAIPDESCYTDESASMHSLIRIYLTTSEHSPFFTESLYTAKWHLFNIYYLRNWHIRQSNLCRISVLNSVFNQQIRIQSNVRFVHNKSYRALYSQIRICTNPNPYELNLTESAWSRDRIVGSDSNSAHSYYILLNWSLLLNICAWL
jgi:hypothetical protein